jgi:hypothetical protein
MPRRTIKATSRKAAKLPLIFISHDSRDADLAEAFSRLLSSVSAGALKSFRSSDRKGAQGIEYGKQWYLEIESKLKSASDVVCLLTQRSVDRPWILYEAGIAKGKSKRPVLIIALGVPVELASTGPFAQFQNSDDHEDSLMKLVTQLVRKVPGLDPDNNTIKKQVRAFKKQASKALAKITEFKTSKENMPETLQKLKNHWERYAALYPEQQHPERFKLYSFCGITDIQESDEASADADLEDIYYLWADAGAGSLIQARILRDGGKRTEIRFDNKEGAHPSNVAFRIRGRNLVYNESGFRILKFLARIPAAVEEGDLRKVQLGIRIIDALKTHWIYSYLEGYRALVVDYNDKEQWAEHTIDLSGRRWKVFETDGNALYHAEKPDFSMILAVVVEVGKRNAGRSGSGKGVVELKDFSVE